MMERCPRSRAMWGRRQALAAGLALVTSALGLPAAGQMRESVQPGPTLWLPRAAHTATRLPDGRVLLAGGCTADSCDLTADGATTELFDPVSGQITPGPAMAQPRVSHAAQLLDDGRVLLLGGWTPDGPTSTTELYDPAANRFTSGPAMSTARADATVARLADGRLLVAGGDNGDAPQASAERFDPATATFTPTGAMGTPRTSHVAVALPDGRVLVAGGMDQTGNVVASAELFDPEAGEFAPTGQMAQARYKFGAVALENGVVLVVAGTDERDTPGALATTEQYDPAAGTFSAGPALRDARFKIAGSVAALPADRVLVAGGATAVEVLGTDGSEVIAPPLGSAFAFLTATPLLDGRVFLAGGYDERIAVSSRSWLYTPD